MASALIDRERLPENFPTHRHEAEFWEHLGRSIASFGFLEEILGKAIFVFTATNQYPEDEIEDALQGWQKVLEHALSDTLPRLAKTFAKVVESNPKSTTENIDELVEAINCAANIRNVLCHASWGAPNSIGFSKPLFVNAKLEKFETLIDVQYLMQVQAHVADLSCSVIDTVTHMGFQFPGTSGPGNPIGRRE